VRLSHPDKVYFPEAGVTKGELIAYYRDVSPLLVPHLRGRPLMLERYPEGLGKEHFYQKNSPDYFPEWLQTYEMYYHGARKRNDHPLVGDAADLLYLVNQGTLTFHVFPSRVGDIEHPDVMIVDIDPPKDVDFKQAFRQAVEAAQVIHQQFVAYGVDLLVKTSGKRGLHLAFPLGGDMDYEQARAWLAAFLNEVAKAYPSGVTTELSKARRQGRVFLEALRMGLGSTVVPAYVVRPTDEATVSMPLTWAELAELDDPREFTVRTAMERLKKTGDLWAAVAAPEG
jgi:bifunctional non-homologous end joining protein LigD